MLFFFFFNDTATTEIYTLSLHDALPISAAARARRSGPRPGTAAGPAADARDRKSTRLNSSHMSISYAVFCLKKKKKIAEIGLACELKTDDDQVAAAVALVACAREVPVEI